MRAGLRFFRSWQRDHLCRACYRRKAAKQGLCDLLGAVGVVPQKRTRAEDPAISE